MGEFRDGFSSHIRGMGSHLAPYTKVYPGTQQLGNESGINGPIYVSNPDVGLLDVVKGVHNENPRLHTLYWRS
jgi:hypothetical protein